MMLTSSWKRLPRNWPYARLLSTPLSFAQSAKLPVSAGSSTSVIPYFLARSTMVSIRCQYGSIRSVEVAAVGERGDPVERAGVLAAVGVRSAEQVDPCRIEPMLGAIGEEELHVVD